MVAGNGQIMAVQLQWRK